MAAVSRLKAPFPYYGGKGRYAKEVWERLGPLDVYSEPFSGSLAMLLANPHATPQRETACDTNGFICNFYRAIRDDPEKVAYHADYPSIHQDLYARHTWLRRWGAEQGQKLREDPDWYDAKAAGWWVWGASLWIGGEWCLVDHDRRPVGGFPGQGISQQVPRLRRDYRPHGDDRGGGIGVSRQRCSIVGSSPDRLIPWFQQIADRLASVIILNRDWTAAVTPASMCNTPSMQRKQRQPMRGVFIDPPYRVRNRKKTYYESDRNGTSDDIAEASYEWAIEHGERYRIAYACGVDDFPCPEGWTQSKPKTLNNNSRQKFQDVIFFSPACLPVGHDEQRCDELQLA